MPLTHRLSCQVDEELLSRVNTAAENANAPVAVWMRRTITDRLSNAHSSQKQLRANYHRAVAAAHKASRGKLSRVDAEVVTSKVIACFSND